VVSDHHIEGLARRLRSLKDLRAKAFVQARIKRLIGGNPGDVGSVW
jgi:putative component of toxin-antitoxin plasmid stabilization module